MPVPPEDHSSLWDSLSQTWPTLGGIAGSIASLAFMEHLNTKGKIVALMVGVLSSVFLGPPCASALSHFFPWLQPVAAGVHFLVGIGAMTILSALLRWAVSFASDPIGSFVSSIAGALLRLKPPHKDPA